MLKNKSGKKVFILALFALICTVMGSQKAFAAEVLTADTDLKGYTGTVTTTADGTNILKTCKGEYVLNQEATLYSSKSITIMLNNTVPVEMGAINAKCNLEFKGKGTLNVHTSEETGIYVGGYFRAFKCSAYGKGLVTTTAAKTGLFVHNDIQMNGGTVEAFGAEHGIYCENSVKIYCDAVLKGTAEQGTGIYTYRDLYAYKGTTIVGEGAVAGAQAAIGYIHSEGNGSSITGISTNIDSSYAALHADKKMLRAYCNGTVREEYRKPTFEITNDAPAVFVTDYLSVARNMKNMANYTWYSEPDNVFLNAEGGLLGDLFKETPKELKIVGYRQGTKANKTEVTQLKTNGKYEVIFSETPTRFTVPITLNYWVDDYKGDDYYLYEETEVEYEIGTIFDSKNHFADFDVYEYTFIDVDQDTFLVEKTENGYVVNYYYEVDFVKQ